MNPYIPVQSINAAKLVSEIARDLPEGETGTVALVMRPCEIRAVIELEKLNQVNLENCILIGFDCPGAIPVKEFHPMLEAGTLQEITEKTMECTPETDSESLRPSCTMCDQFFCTSGDINIAWIGLKEDDFNVEVLSERGKELLEGIETGQIDTAENRKKLLDHIRARKQENQPAELEPLFELLKPCIRCYNCREVCPICYCKECLLTPEKMGYTSNRHLLRAKKKGKLTMPVDTMLYHLTKMNHMASSCVACGLCEQACPSEIPLSRVYNLMSREVQSLFDYRAGRDREEELPVVTFRENELPDVEDVHHE
jgi:formate dehydrogenase subunit beta